MIIKIIIFFSQIIILRSIIEILIFITQIIIFLILIPSIILKIIIFRAQILIRIISFNFIIQINYMVFFMVIIFYFKFINYNKKNYIFTLQMDPVSGPNALGSCLRTQVKWVMCQDQSAMGLAWGSISWILCLDWIHQGPVSGPDYPESSIRTQA